MSQDQSSLIIDPLPIYPISKPTGEIEATDFRITSTDDQSKIYETPPLQLYHSHNGHLILKPRELVQNFLQNTFFAGICGYHEHDREYCIEAFADIVIDQRTDWLLTEVQAWENGVIRLYFLRNYKNDASKKNVYRQPFDVGLALNDVEFIITNANKTKMYHISRIITKVKPGGLGGTIRHYRTTVTELVNSNVTRQFVKDSDEKIGRIYLYE